MSAGYTAWFFIFGLILPFMRPRFDLPAGLLNGGGNQIVVSVLLIVLIIHYHFTIPALNAFTFAFVFVISIQLFLKFYRAPGTKRNKFLVGMQASNLSGQSGWLMKDVGPGQVGLVRLSDPYFKNEEMECIADENIQAGQPVKVVEVDCGLLKITKS